MSRLASIYICQSCGAQTRQFFGRCSNCGDWNSIVEQAVSSVNSKSNQRKPHSFKDPRPQLSEPIGALKEKALDRLTSGYGEFDRVLGGGLVPGSLVLVGGDPGIGKSTLLLQSATTMALQQSVLYVSAEESAQQVRLRWKRLQGPESNLQLLAETSLELVLQELEALQPAVAIIDSIQALHDEHLSGAPGSVGQVRECSSALQRLAKQQNTSLLLVGHVTKEGMLAGPKVLEHLVDVVLTFEGDRYASHRLLRAVKNRYGATHELGIFEMQGNGLIEVTNPSEIFLNRKSAAGVATIVACEGNRSLAVDLQALISATTYASPRRTATGVETNRLHQILAVLEKHMGLALSRHDCYLAVAGGLEVEEPAADLGIATAVISSYRDLILPEGTVLIGELGLGGQLRPVGQIQQRLQEAERLGFQRAVFPKGSGLEQMQTEVKLQCFEASNISEALVMALGVDLENDQN
ncbi:DNA repair protein RadA [Prochlorococcus sp. MIT 1307]|uniref:DNA repair protein RadA n=1 Tax=Prochlorococcus sp. MIT 1307 TaxID=3096219 RepID=UPI002A74C020|nr:DNA repair protein RadA [Prochlorococcus sp. MIT 1307]